jgi:hypothetical protein
MYRVKHSARKLLLLSRGSAVLSKFAGYLTECENSLEKSNYNDPKGKVRGTHLLGNNPTSSHKKKRVGADFWIA